LKNLLCNVSFTPSDPAAAVPNKYCSQWESMENGRYDEKVLFPW
jgi:fatty acid synthase subunit beta